MKIKTIAIDDEPLALKLVADYVQKTPFLDLSATFDNPLDAIDFLTDNHVDLILIDIQMPQDNRNNGSLSFLRKCGPNHTQRSSIAKG